ncbi:hypothetical protein ACFLWN_04495 [Chloroflexota bacterium]
MEYPINQSAWSRSCNDTSAWLHSHILAWFFAFLVPGGGTVLATSVVPPDVAPGLTALYGFLGGLGGIIFLLIAVYAVELTKAPYKQRNEVRQIIEKLEDEFKKSKPFDVECRTTTIGLPINHQKDGNMESFCRRNQPFTDFHHSQG